VFLALREIARNRARFALLGGAIGLLVVLLLFFQSVAGALTSALTGSVANQSAQVVVYDDRARRNPAASVLPAETVDAVAEVDGVGDAAGVVQAFVTMVGPDGEEVDGVVVGIDPGAPGTPTDVEGDLPGDGQALASGSGFQPGFEVGTRVVAGPDGTELEVVGRAGDASANASPTLYVTAPTFTDVVAGTGGPPSGGDGPPLSWVGAVPAGDTTPEQLAERIERDVDGVEALARTDAVGALPGVGTISRSFGILYVLLYVVVTIVTGVFFLILTVQKRDALVLLRAVGARRRDVVVPVLLQVVAVVGLGALIGTGVTAGLLATARDTFGAGLAPATAVTSSAAILGLGLLAAVAAVRRVLAIQPVEATTTGGLE
jgi:putative ABC transport system permease protein